MTHFFKKKLEHCCKELNMYEMFLCMCCIIFLVGFSKTQLGPIQLSYSSTKEQHDSFLKQDDHVTSVTL